MMQILSLMDLIWKASLCSGRQCIGPAYGIWFLLGSKKDTAASVFHSPFQAAKPSLSEHVNCLFNWLLQLRERGSYTKSIRYLHIHIQNSVSGLLSMFTYHKVFLHPTASQLWFPLIQIFGHFCLCNSLD